MYQIFYSWHSDFWKLVLVKRYIWNMLQLVDEMWSTPLRRCDWLDVKCAGSSPSPFEDLTLTGGEIYRIPPLPCSFGQTLMVLLLDVKCGGSHLPLMWLCLDVKCSTSHPQMMWLTGCEMWRITPTPKWCDFGCEMCRSPIKGYIREWNRYVLIFKYYR